MTTTATLDAETRERLRSELEDIDGVQRALIEGPPWEVYLVCDRVEQVPTELFVRSILTRHGIPASDAEVRVCHLPAPEPRRRVRFLSARLEVPRSGRAHAEVELEWGGQTYHGELEGESGAALELRLSALATIRTLEGILQERLRFHLVGIKNVRAFDADVIVALVRVEEEEGKHLIGASLVTEDPHRAAALAVLNATNRVLGNYLSNTDG
ncbi:MAG TPA: hypothetical protein VFX98_16770 [Longimicrobiaceae bacterium]|nr:hypothetical protein [Longimicrobiaceae bacterium]